jgi:phage shock protein E
MLRRIFNSVLLSLFTTGRFLFAEDPAVHTKDSLETVKSNLKDGKALLIDVREQREWDAGHLKGAIPMPMSKLNKDEQLPELLKLLPKDKVIYVHCKAGGRALTCGDILKANGYDVRPLKPGYDDLLQAGFEKAP